MSMLIKIGKKVTYFVNPTHKVTRPNNHVVLQDPTTNQKRFISTTITPVSEWLPLIKPDSHLKKSSCQITRQIKLIISLIVEDL